MTSTTNTNPRPALTRRWAGATSALMLGLLSACGGGEEGGRGDPGVAASCSAPDRKQWLQDYFQGSLSVLPQYFWYRSSPNPSPLGFVDQTDYFDALLYTRGDPNFTAADRWSNAERTEDFNRFFGAGQTMGYGVSVAGLEVSGNRNAPLYVRIVDPTSPAAASGQVARGDQVVSIGPYSAAEVIDQVTADTFTILSPTAAGSTVSLVLRKPAGNTVTVNLTSAVYALTPVSGAGVVTNASGRRIGYVFVRNMVQQAATDLNAAFGTFRNAGVNDLVVDLRYNGGGVVDVGRLLASYIGGTQDNGKLYARLLFNDQNSHKNTDTLFQALGNSLDMPRVYVLAGERTCSAAEQVISGLRGIGMPVTVIGGTTCGKPVGFVPQSDGCGTTYNAVNFESVNAANNGRYFNGIPAECTVAENFQSAIGSSTDPLFNAARLMADGSACSAAGGGLATVQSVAAGGEGASPPRRRARPGADGERAGMFPR